MRGGISFHGHVSEGPPIIPDSRIAQGSGLKPWPVFYAPSHRRRGASASHTPRLPWFAHSLVPPHASVYRQLYVWPHAANETAKCPESLRPLPVLPPFGGDVYRLLRGHYSSVVATTNSCAKPI